MTKIFQPFADLFTYLDYYRKARRMQSDFNNMLALWNSIGGFNASTGTLLNFVSECATLMVEYATWTTTTFDDQIVKMIHNILIDHRDTLRSMIDRLRLGQELTTTELLAMTEAVSVDSDEYGDPMTVLYILGIIYHALLYLKSLKDGKQPQPTPDTVPPERKRPVMNFIRTIFNKQ